MYSEEPFKFGGDPVRAEALSLMVRHDSWNRVLAKTTSPKLKRELREELQENAEKMERFIEKIGK